ncbi:hypothetical protein DSECCO2_598890 [anaerobic digester metagenome]
MQEFLVFAQSHFVKFLLQVIFHRFHIVVGNAFDFLYLCSILKSKIAAERPEFFKIGFGNAVQLGQRQFAKGDKVFNLNKYAIVNERCF